MEDKAEVLKPAESEEITAAAAASPVAGLSAASAPSPAPSSTSSTGRRPYVPQFSAATQMILSRINNKPGSLSAALSSATSVARSIEKSTFEDAKRRLVMNMNTSLTMPMPDVKPFQSASRTLAMPIGDAFQLRTPAPIPTSGITKSTSTKSAASKTLSTKQKGKATRGMKRKRGKNNDDISSSLSELSDSDTELATKSQTAATMTKSGRQVQKPTQFNPAEAAGSQKRKHYGKRTAEQALCKVCTRGLSPNTNQIVFCDGCNSCWHQLCHDPYIDDDFVSNESQSWFCSRCVAKREKALAKKKSLEGFKGVSWASKSAAQKRSYLSNVPHAQLVNIIMYSTELHPELPIFPAQESGPSTKRGSQSLLASSTTAGLFTRADAKLSGPTNFIHPASTPDTKTSENSHTSAKTSVKAKGSTEVQGQAERESTVESIPPAWPKVGQGCLAGLDMNEDDLRDSNDYEAFSVTTYDGKGKKLIENGMPV
ncbi:hypothetical protein F5Y19DRAFT_370608 [Xylariaceae sp. FL1651]|nr:hypothetical protein F5Y19DRAFT_370608 [Xylariaceae sp. FL1651]